MKYEQNFLNTTVKGLAEVTEKQARGQPQLQAIFGTGGKKKRRRNRKTKTEVGETSETDDENTVPAKRHSHPDARPPAQRLGSARLASTQATAVHHEQQVDPSRILEQSMATAEVRVHLPPQLLLKFFKIRLGQKMEVLFQSRVWMRVRFNTCEGSMLSNMFDVTGVFADSYPSGETMLLAAGPSNSVAGQSGKSHFLQSF